MGHYDDDYIERYIANDYILNNVDIKKFINDNKNKNNLGELLLKFLNEYKDRIRSGEPEVKKTNPNYNIYLSESDDSDDVHKLIKQYINKNKTKKKK